MIQILADHDLNAIVSIQDARADYRPALHGAGCIAPLNVDKRPEGKNRG